MAITLTLMGRATLLRDGTPVKLEPRVMAVLIRLALNLGRSVRLEDLTREAMIDAPGAGAWRAKVPRESRVAVYQCISTLRTALDPDRPGDASVLLVRDPGRNSGYRLELPPESIDLVRFERLVSEGADDSPLRTTLLLRQALDLWQGRPLIDVEHLAWAQPRIVALTKAWHDARRRLLDLYGVLGHPAEALKIGRALVTDHPGDTALRERVDSLATQIREAPAISHPTGWSGGRLTVRIGDLYDQDDTHLVIGFSDTFETNTKDDFLVARRSIQGQLVQRLYSGDHRALDRGLRTALNGRPYTAETRATKRYGKLRRYPIGTVAVIPHSGRRLFAVAYSRVNEHGVHATSTLPLLREALNRLWTEVREKAQHRPVSIAVVGSGLARIRDVDHMSLIMLITETFMSAQSSGRITDELRIMVHPTNTPALDLPAVDSTIAAIIARHSERQVSL
ncbi:macro domain-containing protein [Sphaerisporangium sp. NPDC051011]|uniref:macro domain-containing protein n=1 Tax=Sphaerisporangium sp. NPDC051011 TaxID=3155792 RepID=UPI003401E802